MSKRRKMLGSVDLLGLNDYGANPGMNPILGTIIGGGVTSLTSQITSRVNNGAQAANADLYGFLAGLGASGVMYAMKGTRHAALGAAVGAFLAGGLGWLEKILFGTVTIPVAAIPAVTGTSPVAGMGIPRVQYLNGLGIPQIQALNGGRGMGIPQINAVAQAVGTIPGVHGPAFAGSTLSSAPPVNLLGSMTTQGAKIASMGGPAIHGLSTSYGATLLGGGR